MNTSVIRKLLGACGTILFTYLALENYYWMPEIIQSWLFNHKEEQVPSSKSLYAIFALFIAFSWQAFYVLNNKHSPELAVFIEKKQDYLIGVLLGVVASIIGIFIYTFNLGITDSWRIALVLISYYMLFLCAPLWFGKMINESATMANKSEVELKSLGLPKYAQNPKLQRCVAYLLIGSSALLGMYGVVFQLYLDYLA